ncbi:hypothetical protein QEN19_001251 [Hanseniaspora menglaensis]
MFTPILGVSFGNISSSIAIVKQDKKSTLEVIANQDGERSINSALSYKQGNEYHGGQAIQQLIRNSKNTIINFRDFLQYDKFSAIPAELLKRCEDACPLIDIGADKPGFEYEIDTDLVVKKSVVEVAGNHFKQLKLAADDYTSFDFQKCILTVPEFFISNEIAVSNMKEAAKIANMSIVQFLPETSAGLVSLTDSKISVEHNIGKDGKDKNVVVADFGGYTSTVTVFAVRNNGIMTNLISKTNHHLGGENFDEALMQALAKEFESKHKLTGTLDNIRSKHKLKKAAIITKKTLSNVTNAVIGIDSLSQGMDFHTSLNRMKYELTIMQPTGKMAALVRDTVEEAGLDLLEIDTVVLTGGSSFTPKLNSAISFLFDEDVTSIISLVKGTESQHPDEMISAGAALQAALLHDDETEQLDNLVQHAVDVPHLDKFIGVLNANGDFEPILNKNTPLPTRKIVKLYKQVSDFQLNVYTGAIQIKEREEEVAPKEARDAGELDDDESDWSDSDDEPEIIRYKAYNQEELLFSAPIKSIGAKGVELTFEVSKEGALKVVARDNISKQVLSKIE